MYLYGVHPVLETLKAGIRDIDEVWVTKTPRPETDMEQIHSLAGPIIRYADEDKLGSLSGDARHQGVVARAGPFPYCETSDVIGRNKEAESPIIALDLVQDPGNLGNIFRACECLGSGGIIAPEDRAVGVTPAVEKAASGATAHVPMARVKNLARSLEELKIAGYWIYGAEASGETCLYDTDFPKLTVFVLGSESKGLRRLIRQSCDMVVYTPMKGKVTSLNVSQACVVVLAESLRRSGEYG